ncbi:uncharacterized protein LOC142804039 isoform X3 [Rhipicephalus microplus]|uniref:uncharacterized protein LOC142804039 isoform X3 n=1 Tax=Rhipicephalus microplus TaxID=6941 RepID=UPI003F6C887E
MPSVCAADGCTSTGGRDDVLFHKFPREKKQADQWIAALKRTDFKPSKTTVICSKHFRDSDYHRSLSLMRVMGIPVKSARLRPGVVPSIFDYEQSELHSLRTPLSKGRKNQIGTNEDDPAQTEPCVHALETCGLTCQPCTDEARHVETEQQSPTAELRGLSNPDDFAAELVREAVLDLDCESGQAYDRSSYTACEPGRVTDKSVQVKLLTRHEASQANGSRILSTSATQTEPHDVSSDSLSSVSLHQPSSLASLQGRLHSCQQCTTATSDQSTMNKHIQKCLDDPRKCHLCPAVFAHNSKLVTHVRTHTGERPFSCVHCSASFSRKDILRDHLRTHTGERPFACVHCNASFSRKSGLVEHIRSHTGERPFSCVHCNASFSRKDILRDHLRTHTGERPFACIHCNASFSRKSGLVEHIRSHTGERPFACVHCNASFSRKSILVAHMRSHTIERPFSCSQCDASFMQQSHFARHILNHTRERPFSCVYCNASFMMKAHLVEHTRIHTGERPFSCVQCNASFSRRNCLLGHIRIHTGLRPYSCVHCKASFSRKDHLRDHVSSRHKNRNS